jgi:hypothetical protein
VGCPVAESFSAHDIEHVGGQVRARIPILFCSLGDDRASPGVAVGGGQWDVEHEVIGAVDADRLCAEATRDG